MKSHYQNYDNFEQDFESEDDEEIPHFNFASNGSYNPSYEEEDEPISKKKRKTMPLASNHDSAPRTTMGLLKSCDLDRDSRDSWNEEESFVLLEVWGERYLELGRRSLRAEDWADVSEKVSEMIGSVKNETECRNQMDVLKNKFKKERAKTEKNDGGFVTSNWVFFKKMDVLLNMRMRGHCGLGCGVDSGEYVFMNPRLYLKKSNVLDEMMDSPGQSEEEDNDNNEDDEGDRAGLMQSKDKGKYARVLAESITRFGEIYEKVENDKRKKVLELEKMRRDFQRDLELQKKQLLEKAEADIAKIRETEEDEGEGEGREDCGKDDEDHDEDNVVADNVGKDIIFDDV